MEFFACQDSHPWNGGRLDRNETISCFVREWEGDEVAGHGSCLIRFFARRDFDW